jgi:crotonobetainyl-CoA:carnitine CoA-transferase CaiB-like acyl-CoA transferase
MFNDPQASAAKLQQESPHRTLGSILQTGFPYHLSGRELEIQHGPPLLGEQTREILQEAGYSDLEIDEMVEGGAAQ